MVASELKYQELKKASDVRILALEQESHEVVKQFTLLIATTVSGFSELRAELRNAYATIAALRATVVASQAAQEVLQK